MINYKNRETIKPSAGVSVSKNENSLGLLTTWKTHGQEVRTVLRSSDAEDVKTVLSFDHSLP